MMHSMNQAGWRLGRGQTLRRVPPAACLLRVETGRLWVTRDGLPQAPAEDIVLERGQWMVVHKGEGVVLEAIEDSAFEWLEPAPC